MQFIHRIMLCAVTLLVAASALAQPTLTVTPRGPFVDTSATIDVDALTPTLVGLPFAGTAYEQAFNAWNTANGGGWRLFVNNNLTNQTVYTVSTYRAIANGNVGGAEIQIDYTQGGAGPRPAANPYADGMALWTQVITTNVPINGNVSPYLDIANDAVNNGSQFTMNAPLYPFQYVGSHFYDRPSRTFGMNSPNPITWTAQAYLAIQNQRAMSITVYQGVQWGFTIRPRQTPEPASFVALAVGGLGILLRSRKHSKLTGIVR